MGFPFVQTYLLVGQCGTVVTMKLDDIGSTEMLIERLDHQKKAATSPRKWQ